MTECLAKVLCLNKTIKWVCSTQKLVIDKTSSKRFQRRKIVNYSSGYSKNWQSIQPGLLKLEGNQMIRQKHNNLHCHQGGNDIPLKVKWISFFSTKYFQASTGSINTTENKNGWDKIIDLKLFTVNWKNRALKQTYVYRYLKVFKGIWVKQWSTESVTFRINSSTVISTY